MLLKAQNRRKMANFITACGWALSRRQTHRMARSSCGPVSGVSGESVRRIHRRREQEAVRCEH